MRDFVSLYFLVESFSFAIKNLFREIKEGLLHEIGSGLNELPEIKKLLENSIRDNAPITLREGNIIREGFHPELDELIVIQRDGKCNGCRAKKEMHKLGAVKVTGIAGIGRTENRDQHDDSDQHRV